MNFDRAQQVLETLQAQCPNPDARDIEVWISAITRAREVLLELQVIEDQTITPIWSDPERAISFRGLEGVRHFCERPQGGNANARRMRRSAN